MSKSVIKFWDKIIVVLLGVVGLSGMFYSCEKYGSPAAVYEIEGVVTDKETSKPIQNIKVKSKHGMTIYTDTEGKYVVQDISWGKGAFDSQVQFEDIDGEENDGDFKTQKIDIKFTKADRVKRGKPEIYVKTQNIQLEHKK